MPARPRSKSRPKRQPPGHSRPNPLGPGARLLLFFRIIPAESGIEAIMNETSRNQGWAITAAAAIAALLFVVGLLNGSYVALAIPVAIITLFALGLVAWVGYTIATIQVQADTTPEVLSTDEPEKPVAAATPTTHTAPTAPTTHQTNQAPAEDATSSAA